MTGRTARLDELLREEISGIIAREMADPRIGFVTVTNVEVAPDLRHATVWVSFIGSPDERRESFRALGRAMPFVRRQLGRLRLKRIPELHLREDDTVQRGTRVLSILNELEAGHEPPALTLEETLPTPTPREVPVAQDGDEPARPPRKRATSRSRVRRKA